MKSFVAAFASLFLSACLATSAAAIEFDCLELPQDIQASPASCNGFDWCACLSTELTSTQGGEAAGVLQAHIYPTDESTPGLFSVDVSGGTLDIDLMEVDDVIAKLLIDIPIGQAENFVLDYSFIVTAVNPEEGLAGKVEFDVRIVRTNATSVGVLNYDPLDAGHSEGLLYTGEVESFGPGGGFLLRYELIPEPADRDRGIQIGDLTTPGFNVPALVSLFDPDNIDPPLDLFTLPATGGSITVVSQISSIFDPEIKKEFESDIDIEPGETGVVFRRGDSDGNGRLEVTDPINNLTFQFLGTISLPCRDAADFDDNGRLEVTDPIANLSHQFLGRDPPQPPAAGPQPTACGPDPNPDDANGNQILGEADDDLGCLTYPAEGAPPDAACN